MTTLGSLLHQRHGKHEEAHRSAWMLEISEIPTAVSAAFAIVIRVFAAAGSSAWQINALHAQPASPSQAAAVVPMSGIHPALVPTVRSEWSQEQSSSTRQQEHEQPQDLPDLQNIVPMPEADHGRKASDPNAPSSGRRADATSVPQKHARPRLQLRWHLADNVRPRGVAITKQKSVLSRIFRGPREAQP